MPAESWGEIAAPDENPDDTPIVTSDGVIRTGGVVSAGSGVIGGGGGGGSGVVIGGGGGGGSGGGGTTSVSVGAGGVGGGVGGISVPRGGIKYPVTSPATPHPTPPMPMRLRVNGIDLGIIEGGYSAVHTKTDPDEGTLSIRLDDRQLKLIADYCETLEASDWVAATVDAMAPLMDVAESLKKKLAERGWTYEEAERIAGDFLCDQVLGAVERAI